MKKTLLLFSLLTLSISSYSQVAQSYGSLKEEDVDMSITDENYLLYKISTTKPKTSPKKIDSKYVIKDFDWNKILSDKGKIMYDFAVKLNDSLKVREPLEGESSNYIYYQADINADSLPVIIQTKYSKTIEQLRGENYAVRDIISLHDLNFIIKCNVTDANNGRIVLGKNCDITTELISEQNVMRFIIAVELLNCSFSDINRGTIELKFGGFYEPQKKTIKKSDVGKTINFGISRLDIIAFDRGMLHVRHNKRIPKAFEGYKYIGNIDGEKFSVKCPRNVVSYVAYNKYRKKPNLNYDKFLDYLNPKAGNAINPRDLDYDVSVLNFGYDVDSVNIYMEHYPISSMLTQVASIRKNKDIYDINTIVTKNPPLLTSEVFVDYVEVVRKYFRDNVRYPREAQDKNVSGNVMFSFNITPEGRVIDVEILSSPDASLSQEVMRIAKSAKIKVNLKKTIKGTMTLVFKM